MKLWQTDLLKAYFLIGGDLPAKVSLVILLTVRGCTPAGKADRLIQVFVLPLSNRHNSGRPKVL